MTWFRVDDGFWRSKKVRRLGRARLQVPAQVAGVGLWTLAGDWCADNLTDGFVPWEVIEDWDPRRGLAERLIDAGLWHHAEQDGETGIQFHDWDDWQPTKDQVEQRRKADAERRAKWREARRGTPGTGESQAESRQVSRRDTPRDSRRESRPASRQGSVLPDPTRPDPSRPERSSGAVGEVSPDRNARERENHTRPENRAENRAEDGTRLPADFEVTRPMVEWARRDCPDVDGRHETAQFRDYYAARVDAVRRDWNAVWQSWMRRAQKDTSQRSGTPRPRHLTPVPDIWTQHDSGRDLTDAEVDDILGPESPPMPPAEISDQGVEACKAWAREHDPAWRAARRAKATARSAARSAP